MSSVGRPTYSALALRARRSAWATMAARWPSAPGCSSRSLMPQVKPFTCRKLVHSRLNMLSRVPAVTLPYSSCRAGPVRALAHPILHPECVHSCWP